MLGDVDGDAVGDVDGVGDRDGDADAVGDADPDVVGDGVGDADADADAVGDGVGEVVVALQFGRVGQTWTVQHAVWSAIRLAKKQTLSPGLAFPMFTVTVVDWPFCNGLLRFVSCGLRVNVPAPTGEKRICDIALPELFATLKV